MIFIRASHKAAAGARHQAREGAGPPSAASGKLGLAALIGHLVAQFADPRCVYLLERLQAHHCGCSGHGNDGAIAVYETAGKLEELRKRLRESKWELQRETKLAEKRALRRPRTSSTTRTSRRASAGSSNVTMSHLEVAEERYFLGVLAEKLFEGGAFTEKWEKSGAGHINAPEGADECLGSCSSGWCALDLYVRKLPLVTRMRREGEGESDEDGDEDGDEDDESCAEG